MCQVLRRVCFTLAMSDDSAMSLALAYSALYLEPLSQKPSLRENVNALEHYTMSLRLVNEQLNRLTGVGWDGVMIIIVGLAAYDVSAVRFRGKRKEFATMRKVPRLTKYPACVAQIRAVGYSYERIEENDPGQRWLHGGD